MVETVRLNTKIPAAIGFGISTPEQAKKMAETADGVIVGSAIVKLLEQYGTDAPRYIGAYVKAMKAAIVIETAGWIAKVIFPASAFHISLGLDSRRCILCLLSCKFGTAFR